MLSYYKPTDSYEKDIDLLVSVCRRWISIFSQDVPERSVGSAASGYTKCVRQMWFLLYRQRIKFSDSIWITKAGSQPELFIFPMSALALAPSWIWSSSLVSPWRCTQKPDVLIKFNERSPSSALFQLDLQRPRSLHAETHWDARWFIIMPD